MPELLVGTADGLRRLDAADVVGLEGHRITALAGGSGHYWAVTDGTAIWRSPDGGEWTRVVGGLEPSVTSLAVTPAGLLIGTAEAHLLRWDGEELARLRAFDAVEGRESWFTPWGGPPDTRSIVVARDGSVYVNVHVGGIVRSADAGESWTATGVEVRTDVHQVLAHPGQAGLLLAASGRGVEVSLDGGATWRLHDKGLHATYARAVALACETVLLTVSQGPRGRQAAIYRRPLFGDSPFERCREGLPEWFDANIDTHCLVAVGSVAAFGTDDGAVFRSHDAGQTWKRVATGLPAVTCLLANAA